MSNRLTPDKALIFRITHIRNVPWILRNGLHCPNGHRDPGFVPIGKGQIIQQRKAVQVPVQPYGDLSDYVPFYFTPYSPMLYNIQTGHQGVKRRPGEEIVFLVTSLHVVHELAVRFTFTDRHALAAASVARFSSDLDQLADYVPWPLLQRRDFTRDPEWPEKFERYQAEALIHRHLPVTARGIVCYTDEAAAKLKQQVAADELDIQVVAKSGWYFK